MSESTKQADVGLRDPLPREFPGALWYGEEEKAALARVIDAKSPFRFYGISPQFEVDQLEQEFAAAVGARHAQAVGSGTNALNVAMAACGVGPGQEVLVPAFFWVAIVAAVVRAGAVPVLVEVNDTLNMDPADLERKITDRSKAVIVVHMAGAPADIQPIVRIAKSRNLKVIEDCAQANGASVGGKRIGTFGDLGIFSFQVNKNITAGEGGMLVTDDAGLHERCNAAHDIGVPWVFGMPQFDNDIVLWGCGSRMGELNAAVIRAQLRKLEKITTAMRTAKRRILDGLRDVSVLTPRRLVDPAGDSGAFLIVCLKTQQKAVDFAGALNDGGLIPVRLADYHLHIYYHVRALVQKLSNSPDGHPWTHPANVPLIRNYARGACPQSDDLFERAVMISVPSKLSDQNIEDVIGIYRQAAKKVG